MNWNLILTVVGLFTTLVLFAPIFIGYALAYHKAKMSAEIETIEKHKKLFNKKDDDIDWTQIFEGETK
jgi:hypothetical protein